jgi:hypothetical protein
MLIRVRSHQSIRPPCFKDGIRPDEVMWIHELARAPSCFLLRRERGVESTVAIQSGIIDVDGFGESQTTPWGPMQLDPGGYILRSYTVSQEMQPENMATVAGRLSDGAFAHGLL